MLIIEILISATQEDIAAFEEPQEFLFMKPISSGDIDCINISAILDNILEGDETFCVLFNSSGSIPFGVTDTERLLNVLIADAGNFLSGATCICNSSLALTLHSFFLWERKSVHELTKLD